MQILRSPPGALSIVAAPRDRDHSEFLARDRFCSLDGLRALSILGVIWHHAGCGGFGWRFLGRGAEGVNLFFAISGFLITTLLLRERARFGSISLKDFYARRVLRIFPLYFGVLFAFCAVGLIRGIDSDFGQRFFPQLPFHVTYTSNWTDTRSAPFGYAWSLACEEQFYLVWPVALVLLGTRRATWSLISLLLANRAAALGLLSAVMPRDHFLVRLLSSFQPSIAFGVLLAVVLGSPRGYAVLARAFRPAWVPVVAIALTVGVFSLPLNLHASMIGDAALALVVGACVVPRKHALTEILDSTPLRRIGCVSYGMYMFHAPLLTGLRHFMPANPFVLFLVTTALAWGAAEISFRTFERFFLNRKARFERKITHAPGRSIEVVQVGERPVVKSIVA